MDYMLINLRYIWLVSRIWKIYGGASSKGPVYHAEDVRDGFSLGWEDPLEEGMETHSSILA